MKLISDDLKFKLLSEEMSKFYFNQMSQYTNY